VATEVDIVVGDWYDRGASKNYHKILAVRGAVLIFDGQNLPKWRQLSKMAPSAICLKRELLQLCFVKSSNNLADFGHKMRTRENL
jgi:hypothetical protein